MKNKDLIYYLFLAIILGGGVAIVFFLSPNKPLQMLAAFGLSVTYAIYGILHHYLIHNLVAKIVVEYILIAMLGIAISFFIFRGGFGF